MKKKKIYIAIGVLAVLGIGGFIIYRRRKSKANQMTVTLDPSGSNSNSTSNDTSQGAKTPFGSLSTIQKAIKLAQEKGINPDYLNQRVA